MNEPLFNGFRDWLDEVAEAIQSRSDDAAARLRDKLAEVAEDLDRRLDELGDRLDGDHANEGGSSSHSSDVDIDHGAGGSASASASSSSSSTPTAVDDPIPAPRGANPIEVDVRVKASKGKGDDVRFKMATEATATGSKNDVSVGSQVRSDDRRPDKLDVKVGVASWIKDKGDGDALDFLLCVTGDRKAAEPTVKLGAKAARDVDLVVNLDFRGLPLDAVLKSNGLKEVACVGENGKPGVGYLGRADEDGRTVKFVLTPSKGGAPVAVLALDISADGLEAPNFPDLFV